MAVLLWPRVEEGGVQAIIRRRCPKALFVHCSSHRLSIVINDVNKVSEVRNVVGTVKAIIQFFRERSQRRKLVSKSKRPNAV